MKKVTLVLCVLLSMVLGVGLMGCSKSSSDSTDKSKTTAADTKGVTAKEVRIATQPSPFASPIFVAKAKGFLEDELKKYGVKIKWTSFAAGPPMNEAFAAGQQDIGLVGDVPLILAKASGQSRVVFAKVSSGEKTLAVVVKPDSDITDAAGLKGKKVAVVKGSYGHHLLELVLEGAGLSLKDIELVNLPVADINNAVAQGQVDAGVVWEPGLSKGISNNLTKVLADGTGIKSNNIFYFATEDFAKNNPVIIEAYIKALEKAKEFIASNPEEAAQLITSDTNLTKEELVALFKEYNYTPAINDNDIKELKVVEEFCRAQDLSQNQVDIDKLVNKEFLNNVGITE